MIGAKFTYSQRVGVKVDVAAKIYCIAANTRCASDKSGIISVKTNVAGRYFQDLNGLLLRGRGDRIVICDDGIAVDNAGGAF